MQKEYWQNAIDAYNKVVDLLEKTQPVVNEMLKNAKRTSTGKLYQKDMDAIDEFCKQHKSGTLTLSFFETKFCNGFKWELSASTYYQKAEQSGSSTVYDFTWYSADDYDRKLVVKKLPEIEEIERKILRYKEIENMIKELDTERCAIERDYGISKFGCFVGK